MGRAPENIDASVFESLWPITSVRVGETLPSYETRLVGVIDSDQGRFVYKLTPWREGVGHKQIDRAADVFDFLHEDDFLQAPKVLHTREGGQTAVFDNNTVLVLEWVEGGVPSPTPEHYRQLGELLGRVNSLTDYPNRCPITIRGVHRTLQGKPASRLQADSRAEFLKLVEQLPIPQSLPESLIHTELRLGNSIKRADGTMVAIDWDEAGTGARVYDPASSLISVFVSEQLEFDRAGAKAFYEGYRSVVLLSEEELKAFFDVAVLIALRYVSWGDAGARFRRVLWAMDHKDDLLSVVMN